MSDDLFSIEDYIAARGQELIRLAYLLCGNLSTAEDIVQSTLLKCFVRRHRLRHISHPDAYVRRVLVNTFLDMKRLRMHAEIPVADIDDSRDTSLSPDHLLADRSAVLYYLGKLPERQRVVLVLSFLQDATDAEIAEALGCGVSTIRSQKSRALATLRLVNSES